MGIVYHGSSSRNMSIIDPQPSTHGTYVYATPYKEIAVVYGKRCGDDLTYSFTPNKETNKYMLIERIPGAFKKMFNVSSSIYTIDDKTFKDLKTGFPEVGSEVSVKILSEEYIDDLYRKIIDMGERGDIELYLYPNKPKNMSNDDLDIIDKEIFYITKMNKIKSKNEFDRLIYLHPNLIEEVNNKILPLLNIEEKYTKDDLIKIFENRVNRQNQNKEHEQFIECAYEMIVNYYPELKDKLDILNKRSTNE